MKLWAKRLLLLAVVGGIVAAVAYAFVPQPLPVDLAKVSTGLLRVTVDEDGRTRIKERYVVSSPLAGRLRRIRLEAGDAVRADGTLLALIEPTDPSLLDARARAESEARVNAARAAVDRAGPALESAEAALELAESELRRMQGMRKRGAGTPQELETSEILVRQRTQEVKAARFAEEIAQYELRLAEAAQLRTEPPADSLAEPGEWQFRIQSPIDGSVLRVLQKSETVVTPGTQLLELGDPRDLEVEIDVLSSDAVRIEEGDRVLLEHWGGEKPLGAVVQRVEPSAFTKISALGVEEQRVNVIIDLVDPLEERGSLGDAYRVEARIIVWEEDAVLKVPTSALFRHEEDWAVFRVSDGKATLRRVTIGRRNALEAQVLEGLEPGDTVVVHPSDRVLDGIGVVPR